MELVVILLAWYLLGQCVYVYHTDAKIRVKCKDKSLSGCLHLLIMYVWSMHVARYRDSKVEEMVDDLTQEAREFRQEVQRESSDLADGLTKTARDAATKVKNTLYHDPRTVDPRESRPSKKKK